MKNQSTKTVLAVCRDEGMYDRFRAASPEATECLRAESADQALVVLVERSPDLVVIEEGFDEGGDGGGDALVKRMRLSPRSEGSQFLVVAATAAAAEIALLSGFDAAILASASLEEVRLSIRAAFLRRGRCAALIAERNFLGAAVRREESLSRQLLAHHVALEEALLATGRQGGEPSSQTENLAAASAQR